MKRILLLCTLLTCLLHPTYAQKAGNLDPTFGTNGIYKTQFKVGNLGEEIGRQLFVQPDGRIIAFAELEGKLALYRYNTDGSVDPTYGTNGYSEPLDFNEQVPSPTYIYSFSVVAMQPDGKVVIGWNADDPLFEVHESFLVRFKTDGFLDDDFGVVSVYGPAFFKATSMVIQPDGKILVGGISATEYSFNDPYFTVLRYNSNGIRDAGFGTGGYIINDTHGYNSQASSIALQNDGKIVVLGSPNGGGNNSFLARYKSNGEPDASWSGDSFADIDFGANALAIQPDNKIVVAGAAPTSSAYKMALRRFNSNGSRDLTFSGDGKLYTNIVVTQGSNITLAIQSTGKILAATTPDNETSRFTLVRLTTTGGLDLSFSGDGKLVPDFETAHNFTLLSNDKIGITGYVQNSLNKDIMLARYNSNGNPDPTLDGDGKAIIFYQVGYASFLSTARQEDGKLVVLAQSFNGIDYDKILTRYTSNGTLDKTFSEDGTMPVDPQVYTVALQPNGKIIVAGGAYFNSTKLPVIARYNSDGSPDRSFANGGKIEHKNSSIVAFAIHANGKIIVAGNAGTVDDYDFAVTRYNSNGTLDLTFNNIGYKTTDFGSPNDLVKAVAIQGDGKVIVTGTAFARAPYDYDTRLAVARYNGNGTLDNTFGENGKALPEIFWGFGLTGGLDAKGDVAIQKDGKIVVAAEQWEESRYDPAPVLHGISRLNSDGSRDESFGEMNSATSIPGSNPKLLIDDQNGGKIILSGGSRVYRYLTNGLEDPSFEKSGKGLSQINDIVIGNHRLYMVGNITPFAQSYAAISAALLNDNQAPVVKMTAPANNSYYVAPATFYFIASASDPDGTISKVEFYRGNTLLKTERYAPYRCLMENVPAGTYRVWAKAYDNLGKTATSSVVQVIVGTTPLNSLVLSAAESNQHNLELKEGLTSARLEQNIPNPAKGTTLVRYYIPEKSTTAQLLLTDLNGRIMQKIQLNGKGTSQVSINTSALSAGTYAYSLYVDGKQADRKMLVIAR
jgi:uncharacterized delta-60 repeat protein